MRSKPLSHNHNLLLYISNTSHTPCCCLVAESCSTLFATPRIVAHQAPLSMGFPRKEYWSGCHFLLQAIRLNQGLNPRLLLGRWDSLLLSHLGSPTLLYLVIFVLNYISNIL